jgi:hypothetical protein
MRSLKNRRKYNKDKIKEIIGSDINVLDIINFFDDIFDQITVLDCGYRTNYMIEDDIYFQDPKNGYLRVSYSRIWLILSNQYSLNYGQIQGLISIWMEITYKLGSLTPHSARFIKLIGWK